MIVIIQTSDGTELSRFDDRIADAPDLASNIREREDRTVRVLSEFLEIAQRIVSARDGKPPA